MLEMFFFPEQIDDGKINTLIGDFFQMAVAGIFFTIFFLNGKKYPS